MKGFNDPLRCEACKKRKKNQQQSMDGVEDKDIACCDCGRNFTFSAGQQRFFQMKGFDDPLRCEACKKRKKNKIDMNTDNSNYSYYSTSHQTQGDFTDTQVDCWQCGEQFIFSAGQQRFFREKGFDNPPRKCKKCKEAKKNKSGIYTSTWDVDFIYRQRRATMEKMNIPPCPFCKNRGHDESVCDIKKSATCPTCGEVGYANSRGFASACRFRGGNVGIRTCRCS
jgi:hypothetical protein